MGPVILEFTAHLRARNKTKKALAASLLLLDPLAANILFKWTMGH